MARSNNRNNVRGPGSALTEFLRDSGITATTIARRAAMRGAGQQEQTDAQVSTSANAQQPTADNQDTAATTVRPRRRTRATASGYGSDDLDEPESPKKKKLTKAQAAKAKAKEKAKKKRDDDDSYTDDDDPYTALSSMWAGSSSRPPVGSFEDCAICEQQFTVTTYTMAANPGPGFLCHRCAKAAGSDPFKKPSAKRKRKAVAKMPAFEERVFPSLISICVKVITNHIDDVEALGNIGSVNMDEIAKALCKSRELNAQNVQLLYDAQQTSLTLYDATNLPSSAFHTLGSLNPKLTDLRLDFCGHMDTAVLKKLSTALPHLKSIELLGPFLVKPEGWTTFFQGRNLESFLITQSPRFDSSCLQALLKDSGVTLRRLRLKEIGQLNDDFLADIKTLNSLTYLDISNPAESCSDDALVDLLKAVGRSLTHLDLSGHDAITDQLFTIGVANHVTKLEHFITANTPLLSDAGIAAFFTGWANSPLLQIDLSRNHLLSSASLTALLAHSGSDLEELNINGWKDVSVDALMSIATTAKALKAIDVGWCRSVDDFVIKAFLHGSGEEESRPNEEEDGDSNGAGADNADADNSDAMDVDVPVVETVKEEPDASKGLEFLTQIHMYGCGRVHGVFPRKPGVHVYGVESQIVPRMIL